MTSVKYEEFENEGNNIFEGYMFLHNRALFRQWMFRPKYFILTPHYIYCFKRRGDLTSIPRDVIPLHHLSVSIDEEVRGVRKHYCLKLDSAVTKKSFNMFCFSLEERNEWLTKILQVLAKNYLDGEYGNRYLHTSYSSRSLSKLSGCNMLQSIELTKVTSLSCMELTNFGFSQEQRRQTLGHLNLNSENVKQNEFVNPTLIRTASCTSYRISADNVFIIHNEKTFMASNTSRMMSNASYTTSNISYRRKSVKRHHSASASFLSRISYISNLNIRQSLLGNSIRTNFIEKLKR